MTLSADDRARVEDLVVALEEAGADVEKTKAKHYERDDVIVFRIGGVIDAE